jgi:hypothetical protein
VIKVSTANVAKLVQEWDDDLLAATDGERFDHLHERLLFASRQLFWQYLPTISSEQPDFEQRLGEWLGQQPVSDAVRQRVLLELAGQLTFYAREDFDKLHESALRGPVTRWLIDTHGLVLSTTDFAARLSDAIELKTWYCGLSDSMAIADFHHVNRIGGINYRPDVRSLAKFSKADVVVEFMRQHRRGNDACPLESIVILEDFIGSGTQLRDAKDLIAELCRRGVPILLVPLIVCPAGDQIARNLRSEAGPNLTYSPVLVMQDGDFITETPQTDEPTLHAHVRALINATYADVVGDNAARPRPYRPFGFAQTGAIIVMFSNTPANTLPVIHHDSNQWKSLFPRSARVR